MIRRAIWWIWIIWMSRYSAFLPKSLFWGLISLKILWLMMKYEKNWLVGSQSLFTWIIHLTQLRTKGSIRQWRMVRSIFSQKSACCMTYMEIWLIICLLILIIQIRRSHITVSRSLNISSAWSAVLQKLDMPNLICWLVKGMLSTNGIRI